MISVYYELSFYLYIYEFQINIGFCNFGHKHIIQSGQTQ
ncbi:MAG: hypothetical protein RIR48_1332, partial [Bacteroidota bacterium]